MNHIDAELRQATDARAVPGVVAVAANDEAIFYEGAFGRRDLSKDRPMTLDSVFWIASMTKPVTSAAAMQLVEEGKLALDESIGRLLPEFAAPQVLEGFHADGKPRLRPAKRPITLRHLLTHTAGYCYDIWHADMGRYQKLMGIPSPLTCTHKSLTTPLKFDPGESWEYSISINIAGRAVEAASGQRLDAYLAERIFQPLGMNDTGFKLRPDQRARLVAMHARGPDGALTPVPFEVPQEPEFHSGGGGLYGTARDYIRFLQMLLKGGALDGKRILKPETVRLMGQNAMGALNVRKLETVVPAYAADMDIYPEQAKKWGLGFLINTEKTAEGREAGSLRWEGLGNTYFWLDPAQNVGGVILMQLFPFHDPQALALYRAFESGIYRGLDRNEAA
jgi:CubicO group peptidase (beta-lactamase class C family)